MEEPAITTFGKLLRQERKRKELNQTQLAELVGTTQQNIGNWEAGRNLPKQDAFDKLIEVFGKDSALALLPPKGEIRLEGKAVSSANTKAELVTAPSRVDLTHTQTGEKLDEAQLNALWVQGRQQSEERFATALPEHLRQFVHRRVGGPGASSSKQNTLQYVADYLSPKLCVEIKRITGNRLETSARLGMHQLVVYRKMLELHEPDLERTYVLALVLDNIGALLTGKGLQRITFESALLDQELGFHNALEGIADTIRRRESGDYGYEDFEPDPQDY